VFSGGEEPRTTSAPVVKALAIEAGMSLSIEELERDLAAEEANQAKERALRLLGYRERSPEELRRRLALDGYPAPVVATLVDRFEELELVDESRFAAMFTRSRENAGLGARRIRRELLERGVSESVADAAVAECREGDLERAVAQLKGKRVDGQSSREKLLRRLISRGFDYSVAREAVARVSGATDRNEPFVGE